jgi:hypothetical protein
VIECVPTVSVDGERVAELLVCGVKTDAAGGVAVGNEYTREGTKLPGSVIGANGNVE